MSEQGMRGDTQINSPLRIVLVIGIVVHRVVSRDYGVIVCGVQ